MAASFTAFLIGSLISVLAGLSSGIANEMESYRPFGSNRLCSDVLNETLRQNRNQIIIERILISADSMINSFSMSSSIDGSNPELEAWARQACREMYNLVDYLNTVCRPSSGTTYSLEMTALLKIRALSAQTNYLCNNKEVNMRELALNNGVQCVRRTNLKDFQCSNKESLIPPSFMPVLPREPWDMYGTEIILTPVAYGGDSCRLTTELVGCIEKNYMRGTDFCSRRASDHFSNIFGNMLQTVGCTSGGGFTPFNVQYNPHNEQQYGGSVNFPSQQSGSWPINNAFPVPNNGEQQQGNKFNYEWNSNPTLVPPYNPNRSNDGNIMQAEISILTVIVNFVFMSKWVF